MTVLESPSMGTVKSGQTMITRIRLHLKSSPIRVSQLTQPSVTLPIIKDRNKWCPNINGDPRNPYFNFYSKTFWQAILPKNFYSQHVIRAHLPTNWPCKWLRKPISIYPVGTRRLNDAALTSIRRQYDVIPTSYARWAIAEERTYFGVWK